VRVVGDEPVDDASQHCVTFDKRLAIGEAKHMEPMCVQDYGSSRIGFDRIRLEMLAAVEFDDEPRFDARKVREVLTHGMLAAKLVASELAIAQSLPQRALGIG